jgi:hypothetical protein
MKWEVIKKHLIFFFLFVGRELWKVLTLCKYVLPNETVLLCGLVGQFAIVGSLKGVCFRTGREDPDSTLSLTSILDRMVG